MRSLAFIALVAGIGLVANSAEAQLRGRPIEDREALHRACRCAEREGPRKLHSILVEPSQYDFATYDADAGVLSVDERRALRVLRGAAQLLPTGRETIGFTTSAERAAVLRAAHGRGARLRIGFFLGFDGRSGTLCLLRPEGGVTTARIDLAYVELVDRDGSVVAREDTERLRAYLDDPERQRVPGEGPRGVLGEAVVLRGARALPEVWRAPLGATSASVSEGLTRCYAPALERGAPSDAQVLVRLAVDAATGRARSASVELTTLGDAEAGSCVAGVLEREIVLPPAGPSGTIELRVPVRLVSQ
ncbi:MAG: hypothetical protein H5U40_09720 [Polyangiaceae bacterium]|nr:hypothetical protein [Polyangiaceae bacterium]